MSLEAWWLYVGAVVLISCTPGPNVLYVTTRSIRYGLGPAFVGVAGCLTALVLMLAANTAFNDFPRLSSILARDGYMPRQFAFIGDRLTRRENASPFLWCLTEKAAREWGAPYGPGLIAFGLDPALVIVVLERLLGIHAEQAQRAIEPVDANGVAVDDTGHRELAEREPGLLERLQRTLRFFARVALTTTRRAARDERSHDHECEMTIQGHAVFARCGVPGKLSALLVASVHHIAGKSFASSDGGIAPSEYVPVFGSES